MAGKTDQHPMTWLKRPSDGAGDGFVTSIRGLFNTQRRKAKAFVLRTMRGEAENEFQGDWSESDTEYPPFVRQLTTTRAKRLIRLHTKKLRSRAQKGCWYYYFLKFHYFIHCSALLSFSESPIASLQALRQPLNKKNRYPRRRGRPLHTRVILLAGHPRMRTFMTKISHQISGFPLPKRLQRRSLGVGQWSPTISSGIYVGRHDGPLRASVEDHSGTEFIGGCLLSESLRNFVCGKRSLLLYTCTVVKFV